MKIITIQKIGYNHPRSANWSYGVYSINFINTKDSYHTSITVKETFGGDVRFIDYVKKTFNVDILQIKDVHVRTGLPLIAHITSLATIDTKPDDEVIALLTNFLK